MLDFILHFLVMAEFETSFTLLIWLYENVSFLAAKVRLYLHKYGVLTKKNSAASSRRSGAIVPIGLLFTNCFIEIK